MFDTETGKLSHQLSSGCVNKCALELKAMSYECRLLTKGERSDRCVRFVCERDPLRQLVSERTRPQPRKRWRGAFAHVCSWVIVSSVERNSQSVSLSEGRSYTRKKRDWDTQSSLHFNLPLNRSIVPSGYRILCYAARLSQYVIGYNDSVFLKLFLGAWVTKPDQQKREREKEHSF